MRGLTHLARQRVTISQLASMFVRAALLVTSVAALSGEPAFRIPGSNIVRGREEIVSTGCAACHTIPGIAGATGNVGPPLTRFGDRTFVAGMLPNTPTNLVRWIRFPQSVVPGNAMPNMQIGEAEARDIAAFLYTLR